MNSDKCKTLGMGRREFLSQLSLAMTGSSLTITTAQGQRLSAKETLSPAPLSSWEPAQDLTANSLDEGLSVLQWPNSSLRASEVRSGDFNAN